MGICKPRRVVGKVHNHVRIGGPGHLGAQPWLLRLMCSVSGVEIALIKYGIKGSCYNLGKEPKSHAGLCFEEEHSEQNLLSLQRYQKSQTYFSVPRIL